MRYVASVLAVLSLAVAGCSSVADVPLIGVPTNAPARPQTPGAYLPIHDIPPPRQDDPLSVADQARIEKELAQARDRGKTTAAADAAQSRPPTRRHRQNRPPPAKSLPPSRPRSHSRTNPEAGPSNHQILEA